SLPQPPRLFRYGRAQMPGRGHRQDDVPGHHDRDPDPDPGLHGGPRMCRALSEHRRDQRVEHRAGVVHPWSAHWLGIGGARTMIFHDAFFIGGRWEKPRGGDFYEVISPSTEEPVARVPVASVEDI